MVTWDIAGCLHTRTQTAIGQNGSIAVGFHQQSAVVAIDNREHNHSEEKLTEMVRKRIHRCSFSTGNQRVSNGFSEI